MNLRGVAIDRDDFARVAEQQPECALAGRVDAEYAPPFDVERFEFRSRVFVSAGILQARHGFHRRLLQFHQEGFRREPRPERADHRVAVAARRRCALR